MGPRYAPSRPLTPRHSRRNRLEKHPRIAITYEIVTPESAEQGEVEECGYIDDEGVPIEIDEYDEENGITIADKAAQFLRDEGATEASSTAFHPGIWYSQSDGSENYRTGAVETRSFHLRNFSPLQERAIFNIVTKRR